MKKYLCLISCLLIVLSCQNNNQKESVPVNFGMVDINSSEFVDILREYHMQYLAK